MVMVSPPGAEIVVRERKAGRDWRDAAGGAGRDDGFGRDCGAKDEGRRASISRDPPHHVTRPTAAQRDQKGIRVPQLWPRPCHSSSMSHRETDWVIVGDPGSVRIMNLAGHLMPTLVRKRRQCRVQG